MNDVVEALEPVVEALEDLGVRYRVGGSVASSALGVPRSTLDVDIACELALVHVERFVAALSERYYIDADMISDAIRRRRRRRSRSPSADLVERAILAARDDA